MENATPTASYIVSLEQRLSALTAERDSLRSTAERLSSERDNLQGVVEKMRRRKTPVLWAMAGLPVAERLTRFRP